MNFTTTTSILASSFDGNVNDTDFWSTGLGAVMATFMGVLGLLVVAYSLIRTIKKVADGKIGDAVKGVFGALVLAVFLFQPSLINTTINAMSNFVESAIDTITTIGESDGSGTDSGGSGASGGSDNSSQE